MLEYNQLPAAVKAALADLEKFLGRVEYAVLTDYPFEPGIVPEYDIVFDNGEGVILWWSTEWPVFRPLEGSLDAVIERQGQDGNQLVHRGKFDS